MVSEDDEGGERLPNGAPCEPFSATGRGGRVGRLKSSKLLTEEEPPTGLQACLNATACT